MKHATSNDSVPLTERPRCVIVGAGGHGRVVYDILLNAGQHEIVGFVDSNPVLTGKRVDGLRVLGTPDSLLRLRDEHGITCGIVAIGDNGVRREMANRFRSLDLQLINAVHPSANIARNVTLGCNIVVAAGALVCAHSQIGESVILNTGCIVDHESLIGTACHICPGAKLAGRVTVESGAFVGIGATVVQYVRVGYEATVGAGAVVIEDVPPMTTVVGVPARVIKAPSAEALTRSWQPGQSTTRSPQFASHPV